MASIIDQMNHWLAHRALAEYIDKGYRLDHYPDRTVVLCYKDAQLGAWPEHGITAQELYNICKAHEDKLTAGVTL